MNDEFLKKLRVQHSGKLNQFNGLLERVQRDGIEPFIAKVEECRANLSKAEAELRAVCGLVGIPTEDGVAPSSVEQAKSEKSGNRGNIPSEQVLVAVTGTLSAEANKSFSFRELKEKTKFSRAQIAKAVKELVKEGKATEKTDTTSKAPGMKPKLFTWKG